MGARGSFVYEDCVIFTSDAAAQPTSMATWFIGLLVALGFLILIICLAVVRVLNRTKKDLRQNSEPETEHVSKSLPSQSSDRHSGGDAPPRS